MSMTNVAVIGGGIAGASAAYQLARAGHQVTLIDRNDLGQATAAGAGIISPGDSNHGDMFFPIAQAATRFYPELLAHLAEDDAGETGYEVVGALRIARDDAEADDFPARLAAIQARRDGGMPNIGEAELISHEEASERFPPLMRTAGAIFIRDGARVDGRLMRDALRRGLERRGGRIITGNALPERGGRGDRVTGVRVNGERIAVDGLVLAPGAWANEWTDALGFHVPMCPSSRSAGRSSTCAYPAPRRRAGPSSAAPSTTTCSRSPPTASSPAPRGRPTPASTRV